MKGKVSLVSVIAVLTVIGAGALQVAVAVATIPDLGIRVAFVSAIVCAVVMDALVIHSMGSEPMNRKQLGVGLFMIGVLLAGLCFDVVLLITHESFSNEAFGWTRALVGVNVAVSLVLAAAFFALSETNTHERKLKELEQRSEMQQANAFHNSPDATRLYRAKATTKFIERAADDLNVSVDELLKLWGTNAPGIVQKTPEAVPQSRNGATKEAAYHSETSKPDF